jgi:UTP:GlnB (protein PII) uridylyltransferase
LSQRRDLDDAAVIKNFARQIQTPENLNLLTLLTFRGFAGHERQIVERLQGLAALAVVFARDASLLSGGTEFRRAEEKQRELLMQEVRELASANQRRRIGRAFFDRCRCVILKSIPRRKFSTISSSRTVSCTGWFLKMNRALGRP